MRSIGSAPAFVEYGFAKRLGLQMASPGGFAVEPLPDASNAALPAPSLGGTNFPASFSSVAANSSQLFERYPIVTLSWLLLYKKYGDPKKATALKDWIGWGLTTGQTFASGLGYIPLPTETAALAERSLDNIS
jgi:phosphate transport system substrate-binding protein